MISPKANAAPVAEHSSEAASRKRATMNVRQEGARGGNRQAAQNRPDGREAAELLYAPPETGSTREGPFPAATRAELARAAAMLAGYLSHDYPGEVREAFRRGCAVRGGQR